MIIGITGNSGSGKTLLSNLLKSKYNANIIDADEIVYDLSMPGNAYYNEIVNEFSKDILLENGNINKEELSETIFSDKKKRKALNKITFDYVVKEIKKRVYSKNSEMIIVDAPLLIESKLDDICDIVISVISSKDTKLKRICKRDNIDKKKASERLNAQPDDEFYIKNSNIVVINNDGCNLEEQIEGIKELLDCEIVKEKEIVIIQNKNARIMQFKKLLEYSDKIAHAFTLKPLDFGSNDTYESIKDEVNNNYNLVCDILNIDSKNIVRAFQTHTNNIKEVKEEIGIFNNNYINVDGLITKERNKILSLVFADCTPIYLYDKEKNIIGNIHSGWQGTVKMISKEAIKFMKKKYNSNPEDIICAIGPTIRKCHFEVKKDVKDLFYNAFYYMPNIDEIITYSKETDSYYIDTVKININLLKEEGVLLDNIVDCNICSALNSNIIHSYRKEGINAGRGTSIISLL